MSPRTTRGERVTRFPPALPAHAREAADAARHRLSRLPLARAGPREQAGVRPDPGESGPLRSPPGGPGRCRDGPPRAPLIRRWPHGEPRAHAAPDAIRSLSSCTARVISTSRSKAKHFGPSLPLSPLSATRSSQPPRHSSTCKGWLISPNVPAFATGPAASPRSADVASRRRPDGPCAPEPHGSPVRAAGGGKRAPPAFGLSCREPVGGHAPARHGVLDRPGRTLPVAVAPDNQRRSASCARRLAAARALHELAGHIEQELAKGVGT